MSGGDLLSLIARCGNTIEADMGALGILTSNIENSQTPGFKQQMYSFETIFAEIDGIGVNSYGVAGGVSLQMPGLNFSQGGIVDGVPLNVAVNGDALFVVEDFKQGSYVYKRASDFYFTQNGNLVDGLGRKAMGYQMTGQGTVDKSTLTYIKVDTNKYNLSDVGFEMGGILMTNYAARKQAIDSKTGNIPSGTALFQIGLTRFSAPQNLTINDGNSYRASTSSGAPLAFGVSADPSFGIVYGGKKEASNIDPASLAIESMQIQRSFNAVQGAVSMVNRILQDFIKTIAQ
ncbi:MAG: flagellar basal body rod C-terminal domain-containing protein [Candidatus Margulisiibacteriota bacterium]|jgi:flagellar hook protein FlgE